MFQVVGEVLDDDHQIPDGTPSGPRLAHYPASSLRTS
jgi:hypothetical protein